MRETLPVFDSPPALARTREHDGRRLAKEEKRQAEDRVRELEAEIARLRAMLPPEAKD